MPRVGEREREGKREGESKRASKREMEGGRRTNEIERRIRRGYKYIFVCACAFQLHFAKTVVESLRGQ